MKLITTGILLLGGALFAQTNAITLNQAIDEALTKNLDLAASVVSNK